MNRTVVHHDGSDVDRRRKVAHANPRRIENIEPVDPTEQQLSVCQLFSSLIVELIALQTITLKKIAELRNRRIEPRQPVECTEPEMSGLIFQDVQDRIVAQTLRFRKSPQHLPFPPIEKHQSAPLRSDPEPASAILVDGPDRLPQLKEPMPARLPVDLDEMVGIAGP